MSKIKFGVVAAGFTLMAFASPAFAIGSAVECASEGGDMLKVKGSDFCLVPIRPAEYSDPVYDGNQLGVVECPGNKLNDGVYCMYPVSPKGGMTTASSQMTDMAPTVSTPTVSDTVSETIAPTMTRAEERAAKKAKKAAEKAAKKAMDAAK